MESTVCSEQDKVFKRPAVKIGIRSKFRSPEKSVTPAPRAEKSLTRLPPLLLSSKSISDNRTPPPRGSTLKLEPVLHSTSRIRSIIKKSLFPVDASKYRHLPRAPSVNDLEPVAVKFNIPDIVLCRICREKSIIINEIVLAEYRIWGNCARCQEKQFPTQPYTHHSNTITFKNLGEYSEFSLEYEIEFFLDNKLWSSVSDYLDNQLDTNFAFKANLQKFKQHPRLSDLLKSTGTKDLIYFLPHNIYWGISFNGTGDNTLGKILMEIRKELS